MNFKDQPQAFAPSHSALLFQNSKPGQPQTSAPDQALFCFNISHQNATGRHRFHEPIKRRTKTFMPGHRTRQRSKCKAKMLSPAKHIAPNDKRPDKMMWAMSVLQPRQSFQNAPVYPSFSLIHSTPRCPVQKQPRSFARYPYRTTHINPLRLRLTA